MNVDSMQTGVNPIYKPIDWADQYLASTPSHPSLDPSLVSLCSAPTLIRRTSRIYPQDFSLGQPLRRPRSKSISILSTSRAWASTNQMREFLSRLAPQDRVLLTGNTRQHQGVEAGRSFEQLQDAGVRTAKLDERREAPRTQVRCRNARDRSGLRRAGHSGAGPRPARFPMPKTVFALSLGATLSRRKRRLSSRRKCLTARIKFRRPPRIKSQLAPLHRKKRAWRVLLQRQDMTGAERSWASRYEINDVIRYTREQEHWYRSGRIWNWRRHQFSSQTAYGREVGGGTIQLRSTPAHRRQRVSGSRAGVLCR